MSRGLETTLVLDIENGSVGTAFLRPSTKGPSRLFTETRVPFRLLRTRGAEDLAQEIEKAAHQALAQVSLVAARIRGNEKLAPIGKVTSAYVFFGAPWSTLHTTHKGATWEHEPNLVQRLGRSVEAFFGAIPTSFHSFGSAVLHTANTLFEQQGNFLLCAVTGEMTELLLVQNGKLVSRATSPIGTHLLIRTLQAHAGISLAEAHSALSLARSMTPLYSEPFNAAATQFSLDFRDTAREIVQGEHLHGVLVVAPEPAGSWVAKALSEATLPEHALAQDPFANGTTVRTLHTRHVTPYVSAGPNPDLSLLVEGVFVDKKFNRIY